MEPRRLSDFATMVDVLRGRNTRSAYIDGLKELIPGQMCSGRTDDQLVYTPDCPMPRALTRAESALGRASSAAGVGRTFDLTTDGFLRARVARPPAPDFRAISHVGWAVNITVTGNARQRLAHDLAFQRHRAGGEPGQLRCGDLVRRKRPQPDWLRRLRRRHHDPRQLRRHARDHRRRSATTRTRSSVSVGRHAARWHGDQRSSNNARAFVSGAACPAGTTLIGW